MIDSPIPSGAKVIHLGGQLGEGFALRRASQARVCLTEIGQVISAVKCLGCGLFVWMIGEMLRGKLPDKFVQVVTLCVTMSETTSVYNLL